MVFLYLHSVWKVDHAIYGNAVESAGKCPAAASARKF
jgi:hypothetical protein